MNDINQQQQYWSWALSIWTYNWYSDVVNFDIVAPTYTFNRSKLRPTSFYYKKRKWYYDVLPSFYATTYRNREVTDHLVMKEWACWNETETHYIYLFNKNSWLSKVITRDWDCLNSTNYHDLCGTDWLNETECTECICACWFDKFFVTDFVKWTPRTLTPFWAVFWSSTWVQENTNNWTVWKFYDLTVKTYDYVNIGDRIYVAQSPNWAWDAVCWQARQIVDIEYRTTSRDYDILTLNAPWVWLWSDTTVDIDIALTKVNDARDAMQSAILSWDAARISEAKTKLEAQMLMYDLEKSLGSTVSEQKWINASYSIYPEWWKTVSYMTCDWLVTIHSLHRYRDPVTQEVDPTFVAHRTLACSWFDSNTCVYSVNEFNWRINMLWSKWYNIFWWLAYDKMSFSQDNTNYVWVDKTSQAVFRNFLVQFSWRAMSVIVYDANGNSFAYPLDSWVWLFSDKSFTVFQNSLYILFP